MFGFSLPEFLRAGDVYWNIDLRWIIWVQPRPNRNRSGHCVLFARRAHRSICASRNDVYSRRSGQSECPGCTLRHSNIDHAVRDRDMALLNSERRLYSGAPP